MKKTFVLMLTAAILAGCNENSGSEYVGKWVNVRSNNRTLEVERNGDSFMLRETGPGFLTGKIETKNIPATLMDGTLQVQSSGLGPVTMSIDKATGNLTNGQNEYKRANK